MRRSFALALVAVPIAALAACSSSSPGGASVPKAASTAACEQALVQQLKDAANSGATGSRPAACLGVDDATLNKLVAQAMTDYMATPSP